ncbi:MAG: flagellar basal body rod protein FlgC [Jatrophihabitans sp.]|uniref:flagellar basal body rod protein FlgC n=1 Tax=Jatrophihabitans sp. TaxID=1932789 RepID=UPI003F7E5340
MFDAIDTSGTGLTTYRTWLDAIANNIANVNDVAPTNGKVFQAQYVQATANDAGPDGVGTGVHVSNIEYGSAQGLLAYDPSNPLADKDGNVLRPDVDMEDQMGSLIMSQRAFQANANVVDRSKDVYESAIAIGKGL